MCHSDYISERGDQAAYYSGQPAPARTVSQEGPTDPSGEQTRRFDAPPAGAPTPGQNVPPAAQPGRGPAHYGWHGHHGRGVPRPLFGLFVLLFFVVALQGVTVGSVLTAIGSLPILWLVLIFGAFAMMNRRRRGGQRW